MQTKILLVDDREDNLLSIEAVLAPDNYQLLKCGSGKEALKILLNDVEFALILMDVKMPILNGFETAKLIHEREKLRNIPIIFITANNYGDDNIYKGYQSGGIDYILKPINPDILRAKVSVFVNLYKKNQLLIEQERKLKAINEILGIELNDRKRVEEKIKLINADLLGKVGELESLNSVLSRFAVVLAHDFHEPLVNVAKIADNMSTRFKNGDSNDRALAERLKNESDRLQKAYLDTLMFSKITIGQPKFIDTDLNALLNELLISMDEKIKEKNATVSIEQPLPTINVIPGLIRTVFQNLIDNALTFTRKNPVIRIRSEVDDSLDGKENIQELRYCRIYIEDEGVGFSETEAEEIFGLFKKLTHDSDAGGAGIGLALCRKIVELHSGTISSRSEINRGSTFIISLPLRISVPYVLKATGTHL